MTTSILPNEHGNYDGYVGSLKQGLLKIVKLQVAGKPTPRELSRGGYKYLLNLYFKIRTYYAFVNF